MDSKGREVISNVFNGVYSLFLGKLKQLGFVFEEHSSQYGLKLDFLDFAY